MDLLLRDWRRRGGKWQCDRNEKGGKRRGPPTIGSQSHPMSKILKLIWQAGAATQTFAPGGKHHRAATIWHDYTVDQGVPSAIYMADGTPWIHPGTWGATANQSLGVHASSLPSHSLSYCHFPPLLLQSLRSRSIKWSLLTSNHTCCTLLLDSGSPTTI